MSKYKPVIKMLIEQNRALGYKPTRYRDEEDNIILGPKYTDDIIASLATGVDECTLTFVSTDIPAGIFGAYLTYRIVLGNDLHETIADFTDHGVAERIAAHIESSF
jgi:hypothetical protein